MCYTAPCVANSAPSPSPLSRASAPAGAEAHDWYSGLRDKYGKSCCDGDDCRPTALCRLPDGREGIVVFDACRLIPCQKVAILRPIWHRPDCNLRGNTVN